MLVTNRVLLTELKLDRITGSNELYHFTPVVKSIWSSDIAYIEGGKPSDHRKASEQRKSGGLLGFLDGVNSFLKGVNSVLQTATGECSRSLSGCTILNLTDGTRYRISDDETYDKIIKTRKG